MHLRALQIACVYLQVYLLVPFFTAKFLGLVLQDLTILCTIEVSGIIEKGLAYSGAVVVLIIEFTVLVFVVVRSRYGYEWCWIGRYTQAHLMPRTFGLVRSSNYSVEV